MAKLTLNDITSGFSSAAGINVNSARIETAFENTLSRDGTTPNQMEANLDMNSNRILNLPEPVNLSEPARLEDVVNAIAGVSEANLVAYTAPPTGSVERTVAGRLQDQISVMDFGAIGDGSIDDTAAINKAIAYINAGSRRGVYFPAGQYRITSALTAITADNWSITGAGSGVTRLFFASTAGTLSTFFTIGSTTQNSENWTITDLWFENENTATMGNSNPIDVVQGVNGFITRIFGRNVAGFITLGNNTAGTLAHRIRVTDFEIRVYGPAGGNVFDIQYYQVGFIGPGLVVEIVGSGAGNLKGIYYHPITPGRVIDSCRWRGVEFNFPNSDIERVLVVDSTDGIIVNQWFSDCCFDHASVACIHMFIGAVPAAASRINNFIFTGCRATSFAGSTGNVVLLENASGGDRTLHNIEFNGGVMIMSGTGDVVSISQTTQDIHTSFIGVAFHDAENTTPKSCISTNLGNIRVIGCIGQSNAFTNTCTFDYGVSFTDAAAQFFVVEGNDFHNCTIADIDTSLLSGNNQKSKVIGGNLAIINRAPGRATTTGASAANILVQTLEDATTYHVRAIVVGVKSDGTERASYELVGTFYRTAAGAVAQQGATTVVHEIESDAAWAVSLTKVSNNVLVTVTGVAATTIHWSAKLELSVLSTEA